MFFFRKETAMTNIIVRVDAPPEFLSVLVEELIKKFPFTVLEIKEEDVKYHKIPSIGRNIE